MFRRKAVPARESIDPSAPVDTDAVRRAAEAVNRGDVDEANRICDATAHPRATAFAAFRYIDPEEE